MKRIVHLAAFGLLLALPAAARHRTEIYGL